MVVAHIGNSLTVRNPRTGAVDGVFTTMILEPAGPPFVYADTIGLALDITHDRADLSSNFADTDSFTVLTWVKPVAGLSTGRWWFLRGSDSIGGWSVGAGHDGSVRPFIAVVLTAGGTAYYDAVGSSALSSTEWTVVAGTFDAPSGVLKLFVNGLLVATTSTGNSVLRNSGRNLFMGSDADGTGGSYYGRRGPMFVLKRAMSSGEVAQYSHNPWALLAPEQGYVPFASGGGAAALAGAATGGATTTGSLSTAIPILGAAVSGATASGSLSTAISLTGATATISATATGALTAAIRLAGDAVAGAIAAGGLSTGIPIAGAATGGGAGTGDLSTGSGLAGAGAAGAAGTGVLTTQITLSGAAIAQAIASGALTTTPAGLAGDGASSSSGSGALSTGIPLAGAAAVSVVGTGGLVTAIALAGAATVAVSATGDLVVSLGLAGAALISAIGSGALLTSITLNGAAVTGAVGAGALSGAALHASPWRTVTSLARVRSVRATARVRRCIAGVR